MSSQPRHSYQWLPNQLEQLNYEPTNQANKQTLYLNQSNGEMQLTSNVKLSFTTMYAFQAPKLTHKLVHLTHNALINKQATHSLRKSTNQDHTLLLEHKQAMKQNVNQYNEKGRGKSVEKPMPLVLII